MDIDNMTFTLMQTGIMGLQGGKGKMINGIWRRWKERWTFSEINIQGLEEILSVKQQNTKNLVKDYFGSEQSFLLHKPALLFQKRIK